MRYGISFDFWNTLFAGGDEWHRRQLRLSFFHEILSSYKEFEISQLEEIFEWSYESFIRVWLDQKMTQGAEARIRQMAERLGIQLKASDVEKTADYFGSLIWKIPPLEIKDLKTCLTELSAAYPLAIISDTGYISGKYIRRFLDDQGILKTFDSLIFSDEQAHSKPHPSVFQLTCKNLQIDCEHLIHIGDLEHTDVRGVLDCGGISIKFTGALSDNHHRSATVHILNEYINLPVLIKKITQNSD